MRKLLQELHPEARRQAVQEQLSHWQRVLLTRWMLQVRSRHCQVLEAPASPRCPQFGCRPEGAESLSKTSLRSTEEDMPRVPLQDEEAPAAPQDSEGGVLNPADDHDDGDGLSGAPGGEELEGLPKEAEGLQPAGEEERIMTYSERRQAAARKKRGYGERRLKGILRRILRGRPCYAAVVGIKKVMVRGYYRRDLADALADHVVLVAVKRRVYELQEGDLYQDRLSKAIKDVSTEYGVDNASWKVTFSLNMRSWGIGMLTTPQAPWQIGIPIGVDLLRRLPATWQGCSSGDTRSFLVRCSLTPNQAESVWQDVRSKYIQVLEAAGVPAARTEKRLAQLEATHGFRRERAIAKWHQYQSCLAVRRKKRQRFRRSLRGRIDMVAHAWTKHRKREQRELQGRWQRCSKAQARAAELEQQKRKREMEQQAREVERKRREVRRTLSERLRAERRMTTLEIMSSKHLCQNEPPRKKSHQHNQGS